MELIMSNTITTGSRQAIYGMKRRLIEREKTRASTQQKQSNDSSLVQRPEKVKQQDDTFIEDLILNIRKTDA